MRDLGSKTPAEISNFDFPLSHSIVRADPFWSRRGELPLESGEVIRDFGISYVTHGARAPADDNVILVLTAIGWQTSAAPSANS
jgi:homoserine acetyltransferase